MTVRIRVKKSNGKKTGFKNGSGLRDYFDKCLKESKHLKYPKVSKIC
jgi:hypothetical protein